MNRRPLILIAFVLCLLVLDSTSSTPLVHASPPHAAQLSGWLTLLWGDGPSSSAANIGPVPFLTDQNGNVTPLAMTDQVAQSFGGVLALNGQRVTVDGTWQSTKAFGKLRVLDVNDIVSLDLPSFKAPTVVSGSQPWISIMCKFADMATEPKDLSYFTNMLGNTKPGLDNYWQEQSYNITDIAGSAAAGWFRLPHPRAYYVPSSGYADLSALADDCISVANPYVNFKNYVGINLMFNGDLDCCAWGGGRYMSLDGVAKVWHMTWQPPWGYKDITVLAHEMGHGFGLPHSSRRYGLTYDNPWDVMSDPWSFCYLSTDPVFGCLGQHTISYHKDLLGWIPPDQKMIFRGNTLTLTLEELALPQTNNLKMVQIPIDGSDTHFYTVEARRRVGYDVKLPNAAVVIHEVDTTRSRPAYLVEMTSSSGQWTSGDIFVDAVSGITITVRSSTASGFTLSIRGPSQNPVSSHLFFLPLIVK